MHGITTEMLADAPSFLPVAGDTFPAGAGRGGGAYPATERKFLRRFPGHGPWLDTLALGRCVPGLRIIPVFFVRRPGVDLFVEALFPRAAGMTLV
ncbi:MAG: hypothetical protein ACLSUW_00155 [Akkermansia sp.]